MSNKIISSINAIIDNQTLPTNPNNVVAIDTQHSRIGVGTASPSCEIDVSGTIETNILRFKNYGTIKSNVSNSELLFNLDSISTQTIELSNIHLNNIYKNDDSTSYINISGDISTNGIIIVNNDLSVNNQLFVQNDVSFNSNLFVENDISVNGNINSIKLVVNDICVNNIYCNNSNNKIDICANLDLSGVLVIDGSLNVSNNGTFQGVSLSSDDRLKHNEVVINNGLNVVNKLVPQLYQKTKNFKVHDFSGLVNEPYIMEAGLIAQELELLDDISFCVNVGSNIKPYSVNYNNIFVYGLAAIKELDNKINNILDNSNNSNNSNNDSIISNSNKIIQLEKIISTQNIEITNLKKRINNLEKKI